MQTSILFSLKKWNHAIGDDHFKPNKPDSERQVSHASHHMAESTVCLKTNKQASMPSEGGHWEREGLETEGKEAQE